MKENTALVRKCLKSEIGKCVAIGRSNHPEHFFLHEIESLEKYLRENLSAKHPYYVVEVENHIVGCGGLWRKNKEIMRFCWGMIHPDWQGQGLGTKLVQHRIEWGKNQAGLMVIELETSQKTVEFYKRFGFEVTRFTKDGIGPGLDKYDMQNDI